MEIQAITEMLKLGQHQAITRLVFLTDSISTLAKIQNGMLLANWVAAINQSNLLCVQCFFLIFEVSNGFSVLVMLVCAETSALMLWQGEAENESTLTLDPPTVLVLVSEHFELTRVDTSNTTSILKQKGISRSAGRDSLPSHFGHCSGGLSFYGSASN